MHQHTLLAQALQEQLNRALSNLQHLKEDNLRLRLALREQQQVQEQNKNLKLQLELVTDMMVELREQLGKETELRTPKQAEEAQTQILQGNGSYVTEVLTKELAS